MIIHSRRLHARFFCQRAVKLSEFGIDAKLVGDLPERVPILIDQHPLRIRIDLHQMSDHREPLRRIEKHQLRA